MNTKVTVWVSFSVLIIITIMGLLVMPMLPASVPSHWNAQGEVDGYSGQWSAVFLLPGIMLATLLLMLAVPSIDPRRANIALFRPQYNFFIVCMVLFLAYLQILTLLAGLGVSFSMNQLLLPAMGLLFIFIGSMIGQAKPNYMIGIRTPWTLNSDTVWNKTHQVGGKAFMVAGGFSFLGIVFPSLAFAFLIVPVLLVSLGIIVYSFIIYRQEEKVQLSDR